MYTATNNNSMNRSTKNVTKNIHILHDDEDPTEMISDDSLGSACTSSSNSNSNKNKCENNENDHDHLVYIPSHLICPLTLEIMVDPVMSKYGHNFEKKAIIDWLRKENNSNENGDTLCPLTRRTLGIRDLVTNHSLRIQIDNWLLNQQQQQQQQQNHQQLQHEQNFNNIMSEGFDCYEVSSSNSNNAEDKMSSLSETRASLKVIYNERKKKKEEDRKNSIEREIYGFITLPVAAMTKLTTSSTSDDSVQATTAASSTAIPNNTINNSDLLLFGGGNASSSRTPSSSTATIATRSTRTRAAAATHSSLNHNRSSSKNKNNLFSSFTQIIKKRSGRTKIEI